MRKIYLVKKNPELPADGNNWLVMNCSQNGTMKRTPSGHRAMYRETQ